MRLRTYKFFFGTRKCVRFLCLLKTLPCSKARIANTNTAFFYFATDCNVPKKRSQAKYLAHLPPHPLRFTPPPIQLLTPLTSAHSYPPPLRLYTCSAISGSLPSSPPLRPSDTLIFQDVLIFLISLIYLRNDITPVFFQKRPDRNYHRPLNHV